VFTRSAHIFFPFCPYILPIQPIFFTRSAHIFYPYCPYFFPFCPYFLPILPIFFTRSAHIFQPYCPYFLPVLLIFLPVLPIFFTLTAHIFYPFCPYFSTILPIFFTRSAHIFDPYSYFLSVLPIFFTRSAHILDSYSQYFLSVLPIFFDRCGRRLVQKISIQFIWADVSPAKNGAAKTTSATVVMKCRPCSIHFSSHLVGSLKTDVHKLYWGNVNVLNVSATNALLYQSILATFIGRCGRNLVEEIRTWYSWASVSFINVVIRRLAFACGRKSKYVCSRTVKENDILRGQNTLTTSVSCHLCSLISSVQIPSATTRKSKL